MESYKTKIYATLLFALGMTTVIAQHATTASGGNASGNGGSVSYSVGQIVYKTNSCSLGSVSQGVQQPYEISTVSIDEPKEINLVCSAYPNPTIDFLLLKIENYNTDNLSYQLYDMNGKLLDSKKVSSNEVTITMNEVNSGTYLMKVFERNKEVKTFKIIKY